MSKFVTLSAVAALLLGLVLFPGLAHAGGCCGAPVKSETAPETPEKVVEVSTEAATCCGTAVKKEAKKAEVTATCDAAADACCAPIAKNDKTSAGEEVAAVEEVATSAD